MFFDERKNLPNVFAQDYPAFVTILEEDLHVSYSHMIRMRFHTGHNRVVFCRKGSLCVAKKKIRAYLIPTPDLRLPPMYLHFLLRASPPSLASSFVHRLSREEIGQMCQEFVRKLSMAPWFFFQSAYTVFALTLSQ